MVLQPAVEAFFMVHASSSEKESDKKETKQEMLSHIEKIAPLPETHSDEKEDESSTDQNKFKNMPQNTIKFLQFAEKHKVSKPLLSKFKHISGCFEPNLTTIQHSTGGRSIRSPDKAHQTARL